MDDSKKDPKKFDIAGQRFKSRLLIGTGKYKDFKQTKSAIDASGAEIVTVAIRRINIGQDKDKPSLLDYLPAKDYTYLPNTAGCYTAEDAVRTLRLARELLDGHKLVKLEVLGDSETLYPNIFAKLAVPSFSVTTFLRIFLILLLVSSDITLSIAGFCEFFKREGMTKNPPFTNEE